MQIVIALVVGAAAGGLLHFLQGGRELRGAALSPILGTAVAGIVWLALTWLGFTTLDPVLWLAPIAAPLIVVPLTLIFLTRARTAHDARERARLGIA